MEDTIDIDGQPIHYLKVGRGSHVLLFLTGTLATAKSDFGYQIANFDRDKYTIVAIDPIGRGKSKFPNQTFEAIDYDFRDFEAEVIVKFMKRLGLHFFSILSRCSGGNLAVRIAVSNPKMVNKIVIWGTRSYFTEETVLLDDKSCIHPCSINRANNLKKQNDFTTVLTDILERKNMKTRKLLENVLGTESLDSLITACLKGWYNILLKNNGNISKHLLPHVKAEVLVLAGGKDEVCRMDQAQYLCDNLEFSRLHIFPNGGHGLQKKYNVEFREVVENFLDS